MKMTEQDYQILPFDRSSYYTHGIDLKENEILVGSTFGSYSKEWPDIIIKNGKSYKFDGAYPMPNCLIGDFFSVVLYKSSNSNKKCDWN